MDQIATPVGAERTYWHPDQHFELHEYVRYYRVSMVSRYVSEEVFESFGDLCTHLQVGTYSIFEVYGSHDLIIRLYSKQSKAFTEAFINWIKSPGKGSEIKLEGAPDDYSHCVYHWLWTDENGAYQKLPQAAVDNVTRAPQEMMARLTNPSNDEDTALATEVVRFEQSPEPGIRFIVMISGGEKGKLTDEQRSLFADDVVKDVRDIPGVKCLEAYQGDADGWLIIDGRVDYPEYGSLNRIKDVITNNKIATFGCRSTTYLCCDNLAGVEEKERLYISNADENAFTDEQLIEKLDKPEDDWFETKGSLRMDMHEFFTSGNKINIKIEKNKPDPILKTIAAFANGEGGVLIVGALEEEAMAKRGIDITSLPESGKYRICGVDIDMMEEGFDKAHRYLTSIVRRNMDTGTGHLVKARPLEVAGETLMAVIVQRSGQLKPYMGEFYVRNGAETVAMNATEVYEYASRRP